MNQFTGILSGGDLRSIGKSNDIVLEIHDQKKFDDLFECLIHKERIVVMRAADAVEKITRAHPEFLSNHKKKIFQLCSRSENKELKWHLALLVPRLLLSRQELGKVWQILTNWTMDTKESRIVRVNALQGLFNLLTQSKELAKNLHLTLSEIEKENIPSLNARIRNLKNQPLIKRLPKTE